MKTTSLKLEEGMELAHQKFLRQMQDIIVLIREAIDKGKKEVFYVDEDIYLGIGEYTTLIFETLYSIGIESQLDCTFIGSGIWLRGW